MQVRLVGDLDHGGISHVAYGLAGLDGCADLHTGGVGSGEVLVGGGQAVSVVDGQAMTHHNILPNIFHGAVVEGVDLGVHVGSYINAQMHAVVAHGVAVYLEVGIMLLEYSGAIGNQSRQRLLGEVQLGVIILGPVGFGLVGSGCLDTLQIVRGVYRQTVQGHFKMQVRLVGDLDHGGITYVAQDLPCLDGGAFLHLDGVGAGEILVEGHQTVSVVNGQAVTHHGILPDIFHGAVVEGVDLGIRSNGYVNTQVNAVVAHGGAVNLGVGIVQLEYGFAVGDQSRQRLLGDA